MAEEELDSTTNDVDDDFDNDTSTGSEDTGTDVSEAQEREPEKEDLKDLFVQEANKQAGASPSRLDDIAQYFSKNEISQIKALPFEQQNTVYSMINRVVETAAKRIDDLEMSAVAGEEIYKLTDDINQSILDCGFRNTTDYMEHLVSFDKEMTVNPYQAIATLIYNFAGRDVNSLAAFTNTLEDAIYHLFDKDKFVGADPTLRQTIKASREAERFYRDAQERYEVEASRYLEASRNTWINAINLFLQDKDAYGNLTFPYAKQLFPKMEKIANNTGIQDLEELYYMAASQDKKIRAKLNNSANRAQPSLSMTNSVADTRNGQGKFPSLEECFAQARAEKGY
jgi:CRISPR/Cas system CSM-associated protein Csm2 small subunit